MNINDRVGHLKLGYGTIVDIPSPDMVTVKWDNTPDFWYNCGVNPCTISKDELTIFTTNKNWDLSPSILKKIKFNEISVSSLQECLDSLREDILKVVGIPKDLLYSDMEKNE